MAFARDHGSERDELGRVDYFLDQLARAVERGDVPLASYETLAPRYLARRADLVAILAGPPPGAEGPTASGGPVARVEPPPKAPPKPVDWTTVLLFLGAFLVIAASAIFALTVWDIVGPLAKLIFMGALTVGFYAAGYFARTKLHLRAGSAALTVVGSAMLLFDAWIIISGYSLEGPMPWAVALLMISLVYWFTEVRLGERFYGVAGAAAQVGWWWLMAAGLQLDVSVRLAGIAVVALVWHLLAERARDDASWGSLARVLLWAAPVVELLAALGIVYNALSIGSSTWTLVASAAVAAISGGIVAWQSELLSRGREWIAGAAQIPLFVVLFLPGEPSWLGVAFLAVATVIYAVFALFKAGMPFSIAALGTEFLAVISVGSLLKLDEVAMTAVMSALALSWIIASRLAETDTLRSRTPRLWGLSGFGHATLVGGFALLVGASLATFFASSGVPLTGDRIVAADVALFAFVLACWAAASVVKRDPLFACVATGWSFFALAALVAWAAPAAHSTGYALVLLLLAGVWLSLRRSMQRYYGVNHSVFGWVMRAIMLLFVGGGLLAEMYFYSTISSWHGALLVLGGALLFAGDAAFEGPGVSASIAAVLAVLSAFLVGGRAGVAESQALLLATATAIVLSAVGVGLRALRARQATWLAVAAACAGTLACVSGTPGDWSLVGGLSMVTLSWVATGFAAREPRFSLAAGLAGFAAIAAAVAAVNPIGWVTIAVLGLAGILLGTVALVRPAGPGGSHSGLGAGFSLAGLLGLLWLVSLGWVGSGSWVATAERWSAISQQGLVISLLILGAYVVVQSTRWRIEAGLYIGYGVFLVAAFVEIGALDLGVAEWYSTALGIYLIAMGYLYAEMEDARSVPFALDLAAVVVTLGLPTWLTLANGWGPESFTHTAWAVVLSLAFVAVGIVLKVRAYLFGGAAALIVVSGYRTITYLAAFWWLVLGLIGMVMLVIALTWERQRILLSETQQRLRDSFERWR